MGRAAGEFGPVGAPPAAETSCTACPFGWSPQGAAGHREKTKPRNVYYNE